MLCIDDRYTYSDNVRPFVNPIMPMVNSFFDSHRTVTTIDAEKSSKYTTIAVL